MKASVPLTRPDDLSSAGMRLGVVVSRFNPEITGGLLYGAEQAFNGQGGDAAQLRTIWVPGSFELPQMVRQVANGGEVAGVLALGALIKGETLHFEVLAYAVTHALASLSTAIPVPLSYGLLTALHSEQAQERSQPGPGNKGTEAMLSLIEMVQHTNQST